MHGTEPPIDLGQVVVVNQLGEWGADALGSRYPDLRVLDLTTDRLEEAADGRVVFWTRGIGPGVDPARWERAVALAEWVHFLPAGIDGVPLDLLAGRLVTSGRGVNSRAIAEYVVAVILAAEKRLPAAWHGKLDELSGGLAGKTVGLVGLGTIGQAVIDLLRAFGVRLVGCRRQFPGPPIPGVEVKRDLREVLEISDHLVLATALTPSTDRLIGTEEFDAMKPGIHLVNVSRGRIVDQDALLKAVEDGKVTRASLDVTDPEPLPAGHPLLSRPEVFITRHISGPTPQSRDSMVDRFCTNLDLWLAGQRPLGVVDLEVGY